ncbi:MAG: shikimate kinase [Bacillota bacterium]|jgi:shikimate dehydrogenase
MYGLIGEKLGHSFSKEIHRQLADYDYQLIELKAEEFPKFMKEKKFTGINVTIPYKEAVIPYLDEIDKNAEAIGAVNTVVNRNGKLIGYNTDFDGMLYLLEANNIEIYGKTVMILGTGGTSKTIAAVCRELKASQVYKVSRSGGIYFNYEQAETLDDVQVIFNASPRGMYPNNYEKPFNTTYFPNLEAVVDVIYNPLNTSLVLMALAQGLQTVGGLEMLVAQAKRAAEIFTEKPIDDRKTAEIYLKLCGEMQNIVLIGMPSCGKSTLGKMLAAKLNRPFVDIDAEIVKAAGKTIPEIFAEDGEDAFRRLEKAAVQKTAAKHGQVIAPGGGVVKDFSNIQAMQQNGMLFFIDRDLDKLVTGGDRPLAKDKKAIEELHKERHHIYDRYCDYKIENNGAAEEALEKIMNIIKGA